MFVVLSAEGQFSDVLGVSVLFWVTHNTNKHTHTHTLRHTDAYVIFILFSRVSTLILGKNSSPLKSDASGTDRLNS